MIFEIEENPNPFIKTFCFSQKLPITPTAFFHSLEKQQIPLVSELLEIEGIQNILLTSDFIAVTKEGTAPWSDLEPQIMAMISDFFASTSQLMLPATDILSQIKALLDARVRPFLQRDGGDLEILDFNGQILSVCFKGKCQGCALSEQTLKNIVERTLKQYIPQISSVMQGKPNA